MSHNITQIMEKAMEDTTDNTQYASFDRFEEFMKLQDAFLAIDLYAEPSEQDEAIERDLFKQLTMVILQYSEQAYLLDPFLERMVTPVVNRCKQYAAEFVDLARRSQSYWRASNLFMLLYHLIKTRGSKTIVHFFPHQIEDLSIALSFMNLPDSPAQDPLKWHIRYINLRWLSLICRIPFDLSRFDTDGQESTFDALESVAYANLGRAGLEREGAALLLAHLYARKDAGNRMGKFVELKMEEIKQTSDVFLAIGTLHVLCEITKNGGSSGVELDLPLIKTLLEDMKVEQKLNSNTLVKKWQTKLLARMALCYLPSRVTITTRKRLFESSVERVDPQATDDFEISEEVESAIEDLLSRLQDRDTTVRLSAAKGIARIAERLPKSFYDQILDSVMALYSIHAAMEDGEMDLPAAAEGTWHGTTLACAELARRGIISSTSLSTLVVWIKKALYFDIRKGAHSIGSNVRDAASYVVWSLARALDPSSMRPFAVEIAQWLVTVACFDREIHVRRAASAAFQENVGRMSLFPHGIDIIRKTDFYSVSIRKNAFAQAAPQVAEHEEYRTFLIDHLLSVTLTHWDPTMRHYGALALREICKIDLKTLGPPCAVRASALLVSVDSGEVDGGLRALAEIAHAYKEAGDCEGPRLQIFQYLVSLPSTTFLRYRNELIVEAACLLISNAISEKALSISSNTPWIDIVNLGLRHRDAAPQDAAAKAMQSVSMLKDCYEDVKRLISEFSKGTPVIRESIPLALGTLAYRMHPRGASEAIHCLLSGISEESSVYTPHVEARRNCIKAIASILQELGEGLSSVIDYSTSQRILEQFLKSLEDYTTDERGDVGSWIRIATITSLTSTFTLYFKISGSLPEFEKWLPPPLFHQAVGGILKQGAERLDNVRHEAGIQLLRLVGCPLSSLTNPDAWTMAGKGTFANLFQDDVEQHSWGDGTWLFPKVVKLVQIPEYRQDVLMGLCLSIGSRNETTMRPASVGIVEFARGLPPASEDKAFDKRQLLDELMLLGQKHATNNNIFIPFLQTLDTLLESGALRDLGNSLSTSEILRRVLNFAVKGANKLKNVQRIMVSMKILVGLIGHPSVASDAVDHLPTFLGHRFPKVRAATAEALYLELQGLDLELDDTIEEALLETSWLQAEADLQEVIDSIVRSLKVATGVSHL